MAYNSNLSYYVPQYYNNSEEVKTFIAAEQAVLDDEYIKMFETAIKNNYIDSADENGVLYYENLYGIPVNTNLSIKIRKAVIKQKITTQFLVTYRTVKKQLEAFYGEEGKAFTMRFYQNSLNLFIFVFNPDETINNTVKSWLINTIPANIRFTLFDGVNSHTWLNGYTHGFLSQYTHDELSTLFINE